MPFYGQRKRVWKTSFWSWKGDAASIMPGPYSLTVTILRQIKRWQFSRQRVLKYVSISFEDDIRDTSRIYAGRDGAGTTQELWCWLSMTKTLTGSSGLSLGGWHSWCQSKEIIAMHKRSWKDFFCMLLSSRNTARNQQTFTNNWKVLCWIFSYIQNHVQKIDVENHLIPGQLQLITGATISWLFPCLLHLRAGCHRLRCRSFICQGGAVPHRASEGKCLGWA